MNIRAMTLAFRMGVRQAIEQPASVSGQVVVFIMLLISYGALLPAIPREDLQHHNLTADQMSWYLVLTETVILSASFWNLRQLQHSIRGGIIDMWIVRPVQFWPILISEWAGRDLPRLLPLGLVGCALGWIMSGVWLMNATTLLLFLPTAIASMVILFCIFFVIGMLAVWLQESTPIFWLYQKALFLLGGLMWPLALYPIWLQRIAWITPFSAILATPGNLVLEQSTRTLFVHALYQVFWIMIWLAICAAVSRAANNRLKR